MSFWVVLVASLAVSASVGLVQRHSRLRRGCAACKGPLRTRAFGLQCDRCGKLYTLEGQDPSGAPIVETALPHAQAVRHQPAATRFRLKPLSRAQSP